MTQAENTAAAAAGSAAKVALVTGAGRRIGRAIALGMAQAGWDVAVHYRHSLAEAQQVVAEIAAMGRRAIALPCDLADEAAVRALLPQAAAAPRCCSAIWPMKRRCAGCWRALSRNSVRSAAW